MSVQDVAGMMELELRRLSARLTSSRAGECVLCYTQRMLLEFDCDGTLRWSGRWRDAHVPTATALEVRLAARGGHCDCEIFWNVYQPQVDPVTGVQGWPDAGCAGIRAGSTLPCAWWRPRDPHRAA